MRLIEKLQMVQHSAARLTTRPSVRHALPHCASLAAGPMAAGPMAAGPMAAGPMAAGPMAAGPMAAGPMAAGPMASQLQDYSVDLPRVTRSRHRLYC